MQGNDTRYRDKSMTDVRNLAIGPNSSFMYAFSIVLIATYLPVSLCTPSVTFPNAPFPISFTNL